MNYWKFSSWVGISVVVTMAAASPLKAQRTPLVVVGDSLAAGVQNESLEETQQLHGFANVIAQQAGVPLTLPLVPYPGVPNTLELISPGFPPVIQQVPGTLLFPRVNPFVQVTDLAVPLQTVNDAVYRTPSTDLSSADATQLATDLVLGFPCPLLFSWCPGLSQVEQAILLAPDTIIVELGSNDILQVVTSSQLASFTPQQAQTLITNFSGSYATLLNALALTHATLIIANIPDVIESAYFMPLAELAADEDIDPGLLASELGIGANDFVTISAIPAVEAILTNSLQGPLSSACPASLAPCVVTAEQASLIREVICTLNGIIAMQAAAHGGVVVDLFSLVDSSYLYGYQVGDVTLTANYLGGLFSMDGLHPTNTGYAIMANEFIREVNASFGANIPLADVEQIASCDPLVLSHPSACSTP